MNFISATDFAGTTEPLRVVGVVGIGHMIGMSRLWDHCQAQYIPEVLIIPPPTLTSKVLKFTFKVSFYTFAGYLVYRYVPIPKAVKSTCQAGLQNLLQGSQSSIRYIISNVRNQYNHVLHR